MFGYIRPVPSELKVKEHSLYKAIYCGLCKTGGKRVSRFTRFLLNYDFVLFCALRSLILGEELKVENSRCPYSPLTKKPMVAESESLTYTAAVFAVFTYYKCIDDKTDKRGISRFPYVLFTPFPKAFQPLQALRNKRALSSPRQARRLTDTSVLFLYFCLSNRFRRGR